VGPVIDQAGFIYASHFGLHVVFKIDPLNGTEKAASGNLVGKLCQTPSINQNGLLIIGTSGANYIYALKIGHPDLEQAWVITVDSLGNNLAMMTGSPLIRCLPDGRTYVADHAGKIYKFNSGAPLMAGMWPTFACGNRRTARQLTYPAIIAALPPFYYEPFGGYAIIQKMDSFGRSVGQSHGYYNSALGGSEYGYSASVWENTAIRTPEYPTAAGNAYKTFAHSVSDRGDIVGYLTAINGSTGSAIAWHDAAYFSGSYYVYLNI